MTETTKETTKTQARKAEEVAESTPKTGALKTEEALKQAVFVATLAALAGKGTPADEAAELAKQYAIAAVAVYF